jgi:hypothetical protein
MTTVCACEKTVVMVKQPGHLTSMKKDRGAGTRFWRGQMSTSAHFQCAKLAGGLSERTLSLCLRASAAGVGLRRSTARTYSGSTTLAFELQNPSCSPQFPFLPISAISIRPQMKFYRYPTVLGAVVRRSCAKFPFTDSIVSNLGERGFLTILAV